jgi:hypothetical protein
MAGNLARHVVSIDTCAPAIEQMQALSAPQQRPATNKKPSHGRGRGKRKGGGQSAAPEPAGAAGIPLTIDGSVLCPPNDDDDDDDDGDGCSCALTYGGGGGWW